MDEQNGIKIEGLPPIQIKNPVVDLLEQILAAAKQNQVDTVGIIAINQLGAIQPFWAGGRLGDLHLGCSIVQWRLMAQFHAPQKGPGILRV